MAPQARKEGPVEVSSTAKKTASTRTPKTAKSKSTEKSTSATAIDGDDGQSTATKSGTKRSRHGHQVEDIDPLLEPFYYGKGLTDPINTARDKWNLLPAFLKVKGLIKQHTDSFNYFVETDLRNIVKANAVIHSATDPKFFIRFTDIRVGMPNRTEDLSSAHMSGPPVSPNECRLRDLTYAAPVVVDFDYSTNDGLRKASSIHIGRIPVMLRSSRCILTGRSNHDMGLLNAVSYTHLTLPTKRIV